MAMRLKGEAPAELAGFAQALAAASAPLEADTGGRPLVACGAAYDGVAGMPHLSVAAAVTAAACGAAVVMHCGTTLGPKRGVDPGRRAGRAGRAGGAQRRGFGRDARALRCHRGARARGAARVGRLCELRDQMGVRGPLHSAERLQAFFGARRFVVGFTHNSYSERMLAALAELGAERAVAVRGIEGSDVVRPGRPTALCAEGPLELPEALGQRVPPEGGAEASAEATRGVLTGELNGAVEQAVALSAGVRLYAAGLTDDARRGAEQSAGGTARRQRRGLAGRPRGRLSGRVTQPQRRRHTLDTLPSRRRNQGLAACPPPGGDRRRLDTWPRPVRMESAGARAGGSTSGTPRTSGSGRPPARGSPART